MALSDQSWFTAKIISSSLKRQEKNLSFTFHSVKIDQGREGSGATEQPIPETISSIAIS